MVEPFMRHNSDQGLRASEAVAGGRRGADVPARESAGGGRHLRCHKQPGAEPYLFIQGEADVIRAPASGGLVISVG